jgi:hypothetical protein
MLRGPRSITACTSATAPSETIVSLNGPDKLVQARQLLKYGSGFSEVCAKIITYDSEPRWVHGKKWKDLAYGMDTTSRIGTSLSLCIDCEYRAFVRNVPFGRFASLCIDCEYRAFVRNGDWYVVRKMNRVIPRDALRVTPNRGQDCIAIRSSRTRSGQGWNDYDPQVGRGHIQNI